MDVDYHPFSGAPSIPTIINMRKAMASKILIIAGNTRSLIANRGDLIHAMQARGHIVYVLVPKYDLLPDIDKLNVNWQSFEMNRMGLNPISDLRCLYTLYRYVRKLRPDKVFSYTIKPVLYGVPASWWAGVPDIYAMITGLGYVFVGNTRRQRVLRAATQILYRYSLRRTKAVFFQNPDDQKLFDEMGVLKGVNPVRVQGSGVHLQRYPQASIPGGTLIFLVIARLLVDKGLIEFVAAATELKERFPQVRFQILGPYDANLQQAVSAKMLKAWHANSAVELLGYQKDVRRFIEAAHVCVLPSYREGTPRSILEAMSMGRPIITTDAPGCRETVIEGCNGFMIAPKCSKSLSAAMERFILNPEIIPTMGQHSRRIAEDKYDVNKVNDVIMESMGIL